MADCYAVTQQILTHCEEWYQVSADQVILIGDSAGATLSCVTSFLCRDRGGLMPVSYTHLDVYKRQQAQERPHCLKF